jgi:hypothetical protein
MEQHSFRLCPNLEYHNWEKWKNSIDWFESAGLGKYDPFFHTIQVLVDLDNMKKDTEDCPEVYKNIPSNYWKASVVHEYTHYLQWRKGEWKEPILLMPERNLDIPTLVKMVYREEDWEIESEAFWVEKNVYPHNPKILEQLETSVLEIPEQIFSKSKKALHTQNIRPAFEYEEDKYIVDLVGNTYYWNPNEEIWIKKERKWVS